MNQPLYHQSTLMHALINENVSRKHPLDTLHDLVDDVIIMITDGMQQRALINHHKQLIRAYHYLRTLHQLHNPNMVLKTVMLLNQMLQQKQQCVCHCVIIF